MVSEDCSVEEDSVLWAGEVEGSAYCGLEEDGVAAADCGAVGG